MATQAGLVTESYDRLTAILNPRQKAQYILFRDRFNKELQLIIRQVMTQENARTTGKASVEP